MKKLLLSVLVLTCLGLITSCMSVREIGDLNMISTRNVDSKADYVLLRNYMGGTKKELKRSKAKSLDNAIDNVVKQTPGGEFVKNAKMYLVKKKFSKSIYYAVEGDIWGLQSGQNFRGFALGSKVQYTSNLKKCVGVITDLTNDKVCQVKNDETGKVTTEKYSELKKVD
jgi:hypothetical protein